MINNKESRKQKNKKVARIINKIFGGLDCGTYNTQKERNNCNIILRNKLLLDKPLQCNLISDSIQLNNDFKINFMQDIYGWYYLPKCACILPAKIIYSLQIVKNL